MSNDYAISSLVKLIQEEIIQRAASELLNNIKPAMKNYYCPLGEREIVKLEIPDSLRGLLLSPFQFNLQSNGYVMVPEEAFKEMIEAVTVYAQILSENNLNGQTPLRVRQL